MGQLTVYEAIYEMRKLSAQGREVSISIMSYSESKQQTEGIVEMRRASAALEEKYTPINSRKYQRCF
jgi:hypothetical protein